MGYMGFMGNMGPVDSLKIPYRISTFPNCIDTRSYEAIIISSTMIEYKKVSQKCRSNSFEYFKHFNDKCLNVALMNGNRIIFFLRDPQTS